MKINRTISLIICAISVFGFVYLYFRFTPQVHAAFDNFQANNVVWLLSLLIFTAVIFLNGFRWYLIARSNSEAQRRMK